MAKFLLNTATVEGHLNPVLPLSRQLVKRGHEVIWISGRGFSVRIEKTGARFHPWPEEIDTTVRDKFEMLPRLAELSGFAAAKYLLHHSVEIAPLEINTIDSVLEFFSADVLVSDPYMLGPYIKSNLSGIPSALISFTPLALSSRNTAPYGLGILPGRSVLTRTRNHLLNLIAEKVMFRNLDRHTNRILKELGHPPLKGSFLRVAFDLPDLVIHTSTNAFEYPRSDIPGHIHFVGPILLKPEKDFNAPEWWPRLNGPDPVILINQGTMSVDPDDLIIPTLQGLKDEQVFAIAVPVKEADIKNIPGNAQTSSFIPFGNLLQHIDVMVTNGGFGAVQNALAKGIPLIVAGNTEDKMEVAARVEWSGAGINLRKKRPLPGQIRDAVREVLGNPLYREHARRIQKDFAGYDAPVKAAELLEGLVHTE
jgi:MGT family glycosyltransferase